MKKKVAWTAVCASVLVMLTAASNRGGFADVDGARIIAANPAEWLSNGRTYDEQRFSPLSAINRQSVGQLGLAWWGEFDTDRGQETTPIMADGVLYVTTAWSKVYAYDARTGRQLWFYDPQVPGQTGISACCDVVNRGAAVWKGRVYVGTIDGRLVAIDARTGKLAWQVQTTDPEQAYSITGAPRIVKDKVIIGNGGADYGVRGYVTAYDTATGKQAWRFYTTPNPQGKPDHAASDKVLLAKAGATWFDGAWKQTGGGGTVWDAITYDDRNDLLLLGVGNGSPWNRDIRSGGKGDNLFLASIVAIRPDTGEYVWHYQETPGEGWDFTATQHIMLADLPIDGRTRRVVMHAPKNGFFYVLDARTGQLISGDKYIPLDWAEGIDPATGRPIENPAARYPQGHPARPLPGPFGGHNWQPMAFSPKTKLVYIPAIQARGYFSQPAKPSDFVFTPGVRNYGMGLRLDRPTSVVPAPAPSGADAPFGELIAWDPAARQARWRIRFPEYWRSGVLATGGDLVFHSVGNQFTAFDADTGKDLWRFDTVAHAIAAPISYSIGGEQYVALVVGYGGAGALSDLQPRRPGRILVFKLGGKAVARPYDDIAERPPLDLKDAVASKGDIAAGQADYIRFCQACHRTNHFLPNLSRTPMILEPEGFRAIVHDGAISANGMPSFRRYLNPERVENLRAFFLSEAARSPASAVATDEPEH